MDNVDDSLQSGTTPTGIPTGATGQKMTLSFWTKFHDFALTRQNIISYRKNDSTSLNGNWSARAESFSGNGAGDYLWFKTFGGDDGGIQVLSSSAFVLNHVEWDVGTASKTYTNGSLSLSSSITNTRGVSGYVLFIGDDPQTGVNPVDAVVDEVRVAASLLSADWIAAEYTNQSSPGTFYYISAEESVSSGTPEPTGPALHIDGGEMQVTGGKIILN